MLARLPDDPDNDEQNDTPSQSPHPHSTRSPERLKLRVTADRVLAAIHAIAKPDSFIEADRAARCVLASQLMLTQLYTDPKPGKVKQTFVDDEDDEDRSHWKVADPRAGILTRIDRLTRGYVKDSGGIWPDGSLYDSNIPTNPALFSAGDREALARGDADRIARAIPGEQVHNRALIYAICGRANTTARANAERTGKWPNGQAYKPEHPDYFFVSKAWDERVRNKKQVYPPDDEQNLPGFPWWMMSRKYGYPDTG